MNAYLITRNDNIGYDEFDSAVVIAETGFDAVQILKERHGTDNWNGWGNYNVTVEELDFTQKGIVLESFNAG